MRIKRENKEMYWNHRKLNSLMELQKAARKYCESRTGKTCLLFFYTEQGFY